MISPTINYYATYQFNKSGNAFAYRQFPAFGLGKGCPLYILKKNQVGTSGKNFVINTSRWDRVVEETENLEEALKIPYRKNKKPSMLIVGVADAQEPFTLLALLSDMHGHKPPEEYIDLHCVDLKPKISERQLKKFSEFYGHLQESSFCPKLSISSYTRQKNGRYKINAQLFDYLKNTFNERTKWDTEITDFAQKEAEKTTDKKQYDIISCNNVFIGIYVLEDLRKKATKNLVSLLKPEGILVNTDGHIAEYCMDDLISLGNGIWQKKPELKPNF